MVYRDYGPPSTVHRRGPMHHNPTNPLTQQSYDRVASAYTDRFLHELDHKPLDREWLDRFAERVRGKGRVLDLGCGPGQVASYLHTRGVDAFGLDLSPAMVQHAQQANPDIEFRTGDMRSLDIPDGSLAGVGVRKTVVTSMVWRLAYFSP